MSKTKEPEFSILAPFAALGDLISGRVFDEVAPTPPAPIVTTKDSSNDDAEPKPIKRKPAASVDHIFEPADPKKRKPKERADAVSAAAERGEIEGAEKGGDES